MKRPILLIVIISCFALTQCKPKRLPGKTYFDHPNEYNNYIVKEQKEVMASFDEFAVAVNNGDKDSMSFTRKNLMSRAILAEKNMNDLADFKEDTLFRYAAVELFRYVNDACNHELKEIIDIASKDSTITEMDVEKIRQLSEVYTIKEKQRNDALIEAQEKFAKKFNVNIK